MNPWGRCRRPGPSKAGITSLTTDKRKGHLRLRTANRGGSQPARLEPLANVYHVGEDLLTNLGPVGPSSGGLERRGAAVAVRLNCDTAVRHAAADANRT